MRSFAMVSCLWFAVATGCKKEAAPPPAPAAATAAPAVNAGPPPSVIGMEDPFVRLTGEAAKSLKAGYKAVQAKKYDDARTAFAAVVSAVPDYSPARFQELKAAALGGHAADVPGLWKELLGRDFVAFAGRLDKPRELAMLRGGPEWAAIKAYETSVRSAYAANLGKGLLFVGRSRDIGVKKAAGGAVAMTLNQEIYQVDLASKRYRRLTETEGRVFAYAVAPERKMISFLLVGGVSDTASPSPQFADASVGAIDLATLETIGPMHLGPPGTHAAAVVLGWSGQGDPIWVVRGPTGAAGGEETSYALDATRTAVVAVGVSGITPTNRTTATPSAVTISSAAAAPDQVSLSEDRKSLQIADEDRTLRATRVLDPDTVRFAPAGKRLAYAGAFDECTPLTGKADKNELYLWERGKKTAARIATAPSAFHLDWPDDDRLVYQAGAGKQSRIHVLELATKTDTVLKPKAGAALVGFGAIVCPGAAPENEGGEDVDADTEDAD